MHRHWADFFPEISTAKWSCRAIAMLPHGDFLEESDFEKTAPKKAVVR